MGIFHFRHRGANFHFRFASPGLRPIGSVDVEGMTSGGTSVNYKWRLMFTLLFVYGGFTRALRQRLLLAPGGDTILTRRPTGAGLCVVQQPWLPIGKTNIPTGRLQGPTETRRSRMHKADNGQVPCDTTLGVLCNPYGQQTLELASRATNCTPLNEL